MYVITIKEISEPTGTAGASHMTLERTIYEQRVQSLDPASVIAVVNQLVKKATEPK